MDIEIRRGLAEARALAGDHWQPLLAYGALGVLLPFLLLSSEPIFSLRTVLAIAANPWAFHYSGSIAGPLYLLAIVAAIVAGAMLAAWAAILAEFREGSVSEIMSGMVAGVAYLLANMLIYLTFGVLCALPILLTIGIIEWNGMAGGIPATIYQLLLSLLGTWLGARLCLTGPIMGEGGKLNPFSAFAQSWRRTASAQWRLFAFYLAYGLAFGLASIALILLHGAVIIANQPGGWLETAMSLGWLILFTAYFLGQILIPAGLHAMSRPRDAAEVFG